MELHSDSLGQVLPVDFIISDGFQGVFSRTFSSKFLLASLYVFTHLNKSPRMFHSHRR